MKGQGSYVPPLYIPLGQSEAIDDEDEGSVDGKQSPARDPVARDPTQWSSGICACADDLPSCIIGAICPCFLFGKNADYLGSGTLAGSCMTHCILWGLVNSLCLCTGGILAVMPGALVGCYACGYRRALRTKYNLQDAPCGDFTTHLFCHLCAICQEYREIRERSDGSKVGVFAFPVVTAPQVQAMDSPQME